MSNFFAPTSNRRNAETSSISHATSSKNQTDGMIVDVIESSLPSPSENENVEEINDVNASSNENQTVEEMNDVNASSSENHTDRMMVDSIESSLTSSNENQTVEIINVDIAIESTDESLLNTDLNLNLQESCTVIMSPENDQIDEEENNYTFSDDPADWQKENYNKIIDHIVLNNFNQKIENIDFLLTKRVIGNQKHFAQKKMFYTECPNKELKKREWLIYSKSLNSVFCLTCKLFSNLRESSKLSSSEGFVDWKHPELISMHEKSKEHQINVRKFILRSKVTGKIDTELNRQFLSERQYWIDILKRVLSAIKYLSSRGLAFRGSVEKFGSSSNGNYLGVLELIAEYDIVLKNHIKLKGNCGSGTVSYLSKTTCEEFIKLLADTVLQNILTEIKEAKYFSIVVDSTPDISHTDQLTVVIRYVNREGSPIERFLQFIPNIGHKGIDMLTTVKQLFEMYEIDIMNCRGQSYDNASNMSGKYNGLQARIAEINPRASFIPSAAHSLNLVGLNASSSCLSAVSYFLFVQEVYNFFSASPHRYELLKTSLAGKQLNVPKSLSATRWSARAKAVEALHKGYTEFKTVLTDISENCDENNQTKVEATGNFFLLL